MAFLAGVDGRQVVVVGDRVLAEFGGDWSVGWPLSLSADGSVVACRLSGRNRGAIAFNGRRGEEFDEVGPPSLSRDGARLAFRARKGDRSFLVLDAERGPAFDSLSEPALSADGRTVAYAGERDGRWFLVVNGRETPVDDRPSFVFVSDNGRSVGYWHFLRDGDGLSRMRVVANGKPGGSWSLVGRPSFSPDGSRVAYAADEGSRKHLVVDDRKFEVPDRTGDPVFSPDGMRVGYGARIGREIWWKILDVP